MTAYRLFLEVALASSTFAAFQLVHSFRKNNTARQHMVHVLDDDDYLILLRVQKCMSIRRCVCPGSIFSEAVGRHICLLLLLGVTSECEVTDFAQSVLPYLENKFLIRKCQYRGPRVWHSIPRLNFRDINPYIDIVICCRVNERLASIISNVYCKANMRVQFALAKDIVYETGT